MNNALLPCPVCAGQPTITATLELSNTHVIGTYDKITIRCPTCTIMLVRDNCLSTFSKEQVTNLAGSAWNLLKRHQFVEPKLYKHVVSGNVYKHLGVVNHKEEVTREWVEHILYEGDEKGVKYTRTKKDFHNTFEEIKL